MEVDSPYSMSLHQLLFPMMNSSVHIGTGAEMKEMILFSCFSWLPLDKFHNSLEPFFLHLQNENNDIATCQVIYEGQGNHKIFGRYNFLQNTVNYWYCITVICKSFFLY